MNQKHPSTSASRLPDFVRKMEAAGLQQVVIDTFGHYYEKLRTGESGLISDKEIDPLASTEFADIDSLAEYRASGQSAYKQAVRITLNGGLGTSMGLTGPKSLLPVKNGRTFLELIVEQAERNQNRLALMNSFNTHSQTQAALADIQPKTMPLCFLQHKYPKILQTDLTPANWPSNPDLEWNPPGHGDVYTALQTSGLLQQLLDSGVRYAFISNSDNLGATMDPRLLGYMSQHQFPFIMEVAKKTATDLKGGHLARHNNGYLLLREIAQCPSEDLPSFKDIQRYCFFNTNNIWVDLRYLQALFEKNRTLALPMIVNPKSLDPRDDQSPAVYQIETAMGSAVSLFDGATAVQVDRSRFFPVKTCNDLLAIQSDCYQLGADGSLILNPQRDIHLLTETVAVELDPKYYGKIDQFGARFGQGAPSLVGCRSLKIEGDVRFEAGVSVRGDIVITNRGSQQAVIASGTTIDKHLNC